MTVGSEADAPFVANTQTLTFANFLEKMRDPSCSDLVRSIKKFVEPFISRTVEHSEAGKSTPDKDAVLTQEYLSKTEATFRQHAMWHGCSEDELDAAGEGLEKYLMTKLHQNTFDVDPAEKERDELLSTKMAALQKFLLPEHMEIPPQFHNEEEWVLAQKNLLQINSYKAPRDKLVCILNTCRVISNLLAVSTEEGGPPPGADAFLPVLIYVTIKANPPNLAANLKYIERYRAESRLVSEAAYFFTNLVSAASFIETMDATSCAPHLDPELFVRHMRDAQLLPPPPPDECGDLVPPSPVVVPATAAAAAATAAAAGAEAGAGKAAEVAAGAGAGAAEAAGKAAETLATAAARGGDADNGAGAQGAAVPVTLEMLEASGRDQAASREAAGELRGAYNFLHVKAGDIRVGEVDALLAGYKALARQLEAVRVGLAGAPPRGFGSAESWNTSESREQM